MSAISIDPVHFQFVPTPGTTNDIYFSTDCKMLRKFGSCFDFSWTEDEACVLCSFGYVLPLA